MDAILDRAEPRRYDEPTVPLLFAVDHCFSIRGQGTILTGTVLQGQVAVGQTVELPAQRMVKKVKSMQMFRRPVTEARRGDRVGICIAQLDASVMERGLVAEPGSVPTLSCAVRPSCLRRAAAVVDAFRDLQVAAVEKIRFFKSAVPSKARFHITIGHVTAMADVVFFSRKTGANQARPDVLQQASAFSFEQEYDFEEELGGTSLCAAQRLSLLTPHAMQALRPRMAGPKMRRRRRSGPCSRLTRLYWHLATHASSALAWTWKATPAHAGLRCMVASLPVLTRVSRVR